MSRLFCLVFVLLHCLVASAQHQFVHTIRSHSDSNDEVTVDYQEFSIRSPNFAVLVQDDTGNFSESPATPCRTYLGTVRGHPGAMASALRKANGTLLYRISFENGIEWSNTGGAHVHKKIPPEWKPQWPTSLVSKASNSDSVIFVAEVGVDVTYLQYVTAGSSVEGALNTVEFSILAANVPFLRDASILHKIGKVVVRKSQSNDPYGNKTSTNVLLGMVTNIWNNAIRAVVGKTHHLALVVQPKAPGGLAWVSTVASSWAYSAVGADAKGDFSVIWRHEAGHNWGSKHYEGGGQPEGPTIMSNNRLSRFSSSELAKILAYKSKQGSRLATNVTISRPPRANMDRATVQRKQPLHLDVLANDLDANTKGLTVIDVQNPSAMDSTTQVTSSSGRDYIVYTPSTTAALYGDDYFSYRIQNDQGRTSTAYVTIRPAALVARWKMDEKSGINVKDSSGNAATGTIIGSTTWDQLNTGLVFKGAGMVSLGTSSSIQGTTSFSISVWAKVPANVASGENAVIIQQKSPSISTTGEYQLHLDPQGRPNFWFGNSDSQVGCSASTAINDGEWHHLVAIRSHSEGRIYLDGKASCSASGEVQDLDAAIPVFIGGDARGNRSFFTGTLMEAKIYNQDLDTDEITYLGNLPEALLGWWKLDERSGISVKDSSWNSASGTIKGTTTWDQDGGLNFGGGGNVYLGTRPSLKGRMSFSIHAWVKIPKYALSPSRETIIQQRSTHSNTTSGFNGQYKVFVSRGKPGFLVWGEGASQFDFTASATINDGEWHHIVAMRDQDEGRIYIDGNLSGSATGKAKKLDGNIPVFMGFDQRSNSEFFTGSLKQVKIYNHAVRANLGSTTSMVLAEA